MGNKINRNLDLFLLKIYKDFLFFVIKKRQNPPPIKIK